MANALNSAQQVAPVQTPAAPVELKSTWHVGFNSRTVEFIDTNLKCCNTTKYFGVKAEDSPIVKTIKVALSVLSTLVLGLPALISSLVGKVFSCGSKEEAAARTDIPPTGTEQVAAPAAEAQPEVAQVEEAAQGEVEQREAQQQANLQDQEQADA